MTKEQYVNALLEKGYRTVNDNQLSLGTLIFNINEGDKKMAGGICHTFWLTLSPQSNISLCPDPWMI